MIKSLSDVTTLLDERLGGAGSRPLSLLRIAVWVVVGLLAAGWLWHPSFPTLSSNPYNKVLRNPDVRVVTLDKNDPRGFRTTHDRDAYTIAWIGASENQSISDKRYTFVPAEVRSLLPEIGDRPVAVDIYFMSGARIVDLYAAVLSAVESDADMIVLSLNPIWVLNDTAVQDWVNLNGNTFVNAATSPGAWPLLAGLVSPQDAVTGAASRLLPAVRDRWSYSEDLRAEIAKLSLLDTSQPPPEDDKPSELQRIQAMQLPLNFWTTYRPPVDPAADVGTRQAALLGQSTPTGGIMNDLVLRQTFQALAEWGGPVLVYVPPVSSDVLDNAATNAALTEIESHLAEIARPYQSDTLVILPQTLARSLPPLEFNDIVHLRDVGPLAEDLSVRICSILASAEPDLTCEPREAPK